MNRHRETFMQKFRSEQNVPKLPIGSTKNKRNRRNQKKVARKPKPTITAEREAWNDQTISDQESSHQNAAPTISDDGFSDGDQKYSAIRFMGPSPQRTKTSCNNPSSSDDDFSNEEEARPGAIRVPGPLGRPSMQDSVTLSGDVDSPEIANPSSTEGEGPIGTLRTSNSQNFLGATIVAELTEDVEQRVQRELEEILQRQVITEAVEVKTFLGLPRFWALGIVSFLCIVALALGLGFGLMPDSNPSPSPIPSNRTQILSDNEKFSFLVGRIGQNVTKDITVFDDPTTDEYTAMYWLANFDEYNPETILNFPSSVSDRIYIERYVLALLSYSMDIRSWNTSFNFLSGLPVCDWNDASTCANELDCVDVKGVSCNDDSFVTAIKLMK